VTVGDMRTCFLCRRDVEDDLTVAVDFGTRVTSVCHTCWERGDEGLDRDAPVEDEEAAA
jgi:hypothetical protein